MELEEVTDPELLKKLNAHLNQNSAVTSIDSNLEEVTDPEMLKRLSASFPNAQMANVNNMPQQESYMKSMGMAPFRMLKDMGQGVINTASRIPQYMKQAQTEVPGLLDLNREHPGHFAMQGLAGANELINQTAQLPLNIANYESDRLHLWPKSIANAIKKITPEDTTEAIQQTFGEPKYPGEAAFRGTIRNIPEFLGAGRITEALKPVTKKQIVNQVLTKHDALENKAISGFKEVSSEAKNRGINTIPLNMYGLNISNLEPYFPKTKASRDLLAKASTGDYDALRKLQTDLFERGRRNSRSNLQADRDLGEEMFDRRDDVNQVISDHFKNTGNIDLADQLDQSRKEFKTLQQTYYDPKLNSAISKMVSKETRKMPKNITNILNEESKPMSKLRAFHPGLPEALEKYNRQKGVIKKAAMIGGLGAIGGGSYGLYKLLKGQEQ